MLLELSIMALLRIRVTYILLIMASYCVLWNIEEHYHKKSFKCHLAK